MLLYRMFGAPTEVDSGNDAALEVLHEYRMQRYDLLLSNMLYSVVAATER